MMEAKNSLEKFQGKSNHAVGQAAEHQVADWYQTRGYRKLDQRWRAPEGEIDLIFSKDNQLVFVEVKHSKHQGRAATALSAKQQARITAASLAYLAAADRDLETNMRFDLATCDPMGRIAVLKNAIFA